MALRRTNAEKAKEIIFDTRMGEDTETSTDVVASPERPWALRHLRVSPVHPSMHCNIVFMPYD